MAAANVRNNPVTQQRAKRNSTSPGEEEGSSPKRPRPSPSGGDHPNPPGPPQNQPPMASMAPFNPQQGGGPPGPQNMQNGMIRTPMNMAYQSMAGFGPPPMSPGMVSIQTPAMMNNTVHMTPEVGGVGLSRFLDRMALIASFRCTITGSRCKNFITRQWGHRAIMLAPPFLTLLRLLARHPSTQVV